MLLDPVTGELYPDNQEQEPVQIVNQEAEIPPAIKCTICKKVNGVDLFMDSEDLLALHFQTCHQDIRLQCYMCPSIFDDQASLFEHLVRHGVQHPDRSSIALFSMNTMTRVAYLIENQNNGVPDLVIISSFRTKAVLNHLCSRLHPPQDFC